MENGKKYRSNEKTYSINRDIQRSFRDLEQTVQPDEFSVETQKPAKTPKSKSEKETER